MAQHLCLVVSLSLDISARVEIDDLLTSFRSIFTMALPLDMRVKLQAVRTPSPRFLFRAFSEASGGGDSRLNNDTGITPHLFLPDSRIAPHASIEEFTPLELTESIVSHLKNTHTPTEFSSWSFDAFSCLCFPNGVKDAYLAVIDLQSLDDKPVHAYYVPLLREVMVLAASKDDVRQVRNSLDDLPEEFFDDCSHEFLIHGKVSGPGYYIMRLDSTTADDGYTTSTLQNFLESGSSHGPLQPSEVQTAKEFAMSFGLLIDTARELFVFLVVSFLAVRITTASSEWYNADVQTILEGLRGDDSVSDAPVIPHAYVREDWIMLDGVDVSLCVEWEATILMLRALTYRQCGKRVIERNREIEPRLAPIEADEPKFEDWLL